MGVKDDKSPITVKVGSDTLREVHSFKYLGARFDTEATCVEEVKTRLGLVRDRLGSLTTLYGGAERCPMSQKPGSFKR